MKLVWVLVAIAACASHEPGGEPSVPRPTSRVDELRPDSPNTNEPPPKFDATEVVERSAAPDASVVVHFTRAGRNAVPLRDADDSGVPDFVESVERTYGQVRAAYHGPWGFRPPPDDGPVPDDNGGDARFDVYLVDFAGRADGAFRRECLGPAPLRCTGYMTQENDFTGYAYASADEGIVTVSSHEYFHAVQAGYSALQGVVVTEGTAVWATERFAPQLNDFENFTGSYLSAPDRSIDQEPTSAVDGFAYGSALFFECLTQQRGDDAVLGLWERLDGGASWLATLDRQLDEDGGVRLSTVLERCFDYNLFTGPRARAGYGHARAERLPAAPVTEGSTQLQVARARMFRAASRYYRATQLPADAVAWWRAADDAPDGGVQSMRVRLAVDVAGAPSLVAMPNDTPTPVNGAAAFVLVSNVAITGNSVPVAVCIGSPAFVDSCRHPDAGQPYVDAGMVVIDAGEPADAGQPVPTMPTGCGCGAAGGPFSVALLLLARAWGRRRA